MGGRGPYGSFDRSFAPSDPQDNDKAFVRKASVTPMGIFPSRQVIFVTLQYLAIKVNAEALP
jgi:hypothetical protein